MTQAVRDNVVRSVERMTGLRVAQVDVTISDIYFPNEEQDREKSSASPENLPDAVGGYVYDASRARAKARRGEA
ncbi:MAG: Asp23/Gls24 family envelope stress response protein [Actinomycetota bacterium]|nr:Asp23/Gls24 family envelope stress response protein [Rubrobacteraceae bacterium]MDQ3183576.1 Asp23/Gls24 family envelope stress response protein [Actinomycetota bacterium]MDQ3498455.1 Asp23/Gls24 family envelope stress response protein [Actinomycetota bacterium]